MAVKSVNNKVFRSRSFKGTVSIVVERCKGCELCVTYCSKGILEVSEKFNEKGYHYPEVIDENGCVNCGVCEDICPEFAIYVISMEEQT